MFEGATPAVGSQFSLDDIQEVDAQGSIVADGKFGANDAANGLAAAFRINSLVRLPVGNHLAQVRADVVLEVFQGGVMLAAGTHDFDVDWYLTRMERRAELVDGESAAP